MLSIGPVRLRNRVALAAMEEHTSLPFRLIAKEMGAGLVLSEMVQPDRLVAGDKLARRLLATEPREKPVGGQLLAGAIDDVARAVPLVIEAGFDLVDVNASCPIRRVLDRGWGGEYLRDPARLEALVAAAVAAAGTTPVTVKMRIGFSDDAPNADALAARAAAAGAKALFVHGRSVQRAYRGTADWSWIKRAKEASPVPVFGAGDIREPDDVPRMLEETGCDGALIARGALGNPWIFARALRLLDGGPAGAPPSREERLRVLLRHLKEEARFLGERRPGKRLLRLAFYYAKGLPDFDEIQEAARGARSLTELERSLKESFRRPGART